jgi:hypothetical protein
MSWLLAAEAATDPLWQKALAVARTNADWVAGLVVMRSEILHKGETNGVHEIWTRSKLGTNDEVITQTVKVLEDGEDVTKEETKKEEKQKKKKTKDKDNKTSGQPGINPFDPERQDRVTVERNNQSRNIEGRDCVGYAFEVRNTNGPTARGIAWLEKETGVPSEIEDMTLDPLPDKHLKAVTTTTRYETTTGGVWRVKEMRMKTKASVLFMNLDVLSTMTFSEYWKRPARE